MRSLSPEEAELWAKVAETIRPLSREKRPFAAKGEALPDPVPPLSTSKPKGPAPIQSNIIRQPPKARIGSTLDGSWDRSIRNGTIQPDRTLDLHGMNLDAAWNAIDCELERATVNGERVILLITGHARAGEPPILRGRIRAAVHDWLAASRHAARIAAVRGAHRRHGGGGSLYIILRRG
ncbi:MAG: Smr/MutS family protein [Sphingomicrobium sp.]